MAIFQELEVLVACLIADTHRVIRGSVVSANKTWLTLVICQMSGIIFTFIWMRFAMSIWEICFDLEKKVDALSSLSIQ